MNTLDGPEVEDGGEGCSTVLILSFVNCRVVEGIKFAEVEDGMGVGGVTVSSAWSCC